MATGKVHHRGEHIFQLLAAAAWEEGDDGARVGGQRGGAALLGGYATLEHIEQRVAYVVRLRQIVGGEEGFFKGENIAEGIERTAHALDAAFLPSPEIGRDVM